MRAEERTNAILYEAMNRHHEHASEGHLSFGLWTQSTDDHRDACANLVLSLGRRIGLSRTSRVLDVACGVGAPAVLLHRTFGCVIDGVDLARESVHRARARVRMSGASGAIAIHHGSGTALPFASAQFTHTICIEGADHMRPRRRFLEEAFRTLVPGGTLGLVDSVICRPSRDLMEQAAIELLCRATSVPRANVWTADTYRLILEDVGFVDVAIEHVGHETIGAFYEWAERRGVLSTLSWTDGALLRALARLVRSGLAGYVVIRALKPTSARS
ncbi:class I SAM-dependent methyltransferase [Sandaracinus amylolyticus]|uniref:class I SAM-dependent methyltransferase n=1 Tax=Sandaracinus amylolyticus TaxID=927083 RepID=UPI001F2F5BF1|nr:class I SAM-dependent methyltransferase [Sandaracinus amylolyticus]UJR84162.1 Hypothetical protein I5071_62330 [Sandaracinus amylolyticus]